MPCYRPGPTPHPGIRHDQVQSADTLPSTFACRNRIKQGTGIHQNSSISSCCSKGHSYSSTRRGHSKVPSFAWYPHNYIQQQSRNGDTVSAPTPGTCCAIAAAHHVACSHALQIIHPAASATLCTPKHGSTHATTRLCLCVQLHYDGSGWFQHPSLVTTHYI